MVVGALLAYRGVAAQEVDELLMLVLAVEEVDVVFRNHRGERKAIDGAAGVLDGLSLVGGGAGGVVLGAREIAHENGALARLHGEARLDEGLVGFVQLLGRHREAVVKHGLIDARGGLEAALEFLPDLVPAVVARLLQHLKARLDQLEVEAVAVQARRDAAGAVLHVGHSLDGERMGGEVGGGGRFVEAVARMEALEEALHALGVEACVVEGLQTHAVGLSFGVSRVVELGLDHGGLGAHGDGRGGVTARISARSCGENGQKHGTDCEGHVPLLGLDHARDVALGDVADFMAHDACKLAFVLSVDDGARVHGDVAARKREGVERCVPDGKEEELVGVGVRVADELVAEPVEVFARFGVRHVGGVGSNLPHDLRAESVFVGG